ncbi:MAG: CBS domain-containing protein [Candidatus Marsarchaeota archaeon]|jgi:CBS domain-containing protein|nr:CBS domain-containing protein [Candidatus Marsarchaeota archaeon]
MEGNSVLVKDAMSKNAITAKAGDLVADIAKIMVEREIGGVIIVDDDMFPIGIVTEGDIVRNLVAKKMDLEDTVAKDIMTTPVITITDDIELSAAARLMAARHIKKLCIVDLDGKLKGIMTESDVIKHAGYLIKLFQ